LVNKIGRFYSYIPKVGQDNCLQDCFWTSLPTKSEQPIDEAEDAILAGAGVPVTF
jgi:hypothetical protein